MQEQTRFHPSDVCGIDLESLIYRGRQSIKHIPWHPALLLVRLYCTTAQRCVFERARERKRFVNHVEENDIKENQREIIEKTSFFLRQTGFYQQPNAATKEIAPSTDATDPHGSSEERFKSILVDFAYLADPERYDSHLHILQGEELDEDRRKLIIQQE